MNDEREQEQCPHSSESGNLFPNLSRDDWITSEAFEQHVGDQGAGQEDDWRVRPEEQARGQAQSAAPVPEASYCST